MIIQISCDVFVGHMPPVFYVIYAPTRRTQNSNANLAAAEQFNLNFGLMRHRMVTARVQDFERVGVNTMKSLTACRR